jgi:hypothetical protein
LLAELRANKREARFINRILDVLSESLRMNATMQERNLEEALVDKEKEKQSFSSAVIGELK